MTEYKPGTVKIFACPSCSGTVEIRAVGISITALCQHCGSVIDIANDNYRIIKEASEKIRVIPLPIGSRGMLFGVEWEVIGYISRTDDSGLYSWREYLLFNPYHGFRFLVEASGHWNFVRVLREPIEVGAHAEVLEFEGEDYRLFNRGGAIVTYVLGEFYWRVKVGDRISTADFVAPPLMLSMEKNAQELMWSKGEYVYPEEVEAAFGPQVKRVTGKALVLPPTQGIAPNQPSPFAGRIKGMAAAAVLFVAALILMQLFIGGAAREQVVFSKTVMPTAYDKDKVIGTEIFTLPVDQANLLVELESPVQNNWLEVETSLVAEQSDARYDFLQSVEYYYGSDSDGAWSEGSNKSEVLLSAIPGGAYRLLMEANAGTYTGTGGAPLSYTVKLTRDVPAESNFAVALLLMTFYPLLMVFRSFGFEKRRWSESDFAPYPYNNSGEEEEES